MEIAGLSTYNSTGFYYAYTQKTQKNASGEEAFWGLQDNDQNGLSPSVNKPVTSMAYSRCITANFKTEEMVASQLAEGEMIYSYRACEQSFQIWINSDGENKTYSIEGIDKDGNSFAKEFDPYQVDPANADFPEFSALCMYIQNTDETADLLASEYFYTDDILEKKNYLEMLGDFGNDDLFAGMQSLIDHANKIYEEMQALIKKITDSFTDIDPYQIELLTKDIDEPDMDMSVKSSTETNEVKETSEIQEEELIPLGFGFANAGNHGYGMSASQVISADSDDVIIRVKVAGGETVDVNLSKIDTKHATPVEMFAYCQYMDSIGKGVNNKWGSWNAMKWIAASDNNDAMDFGSFENIMNKKMDWAGALSASKRSFEHAKSGNVISAADLLKMLEEAGHISAQDLKSDDWRDMSDEEWDKMMEEVDSYIDEFKEEIKRMKEMKEEAARKAAMEAPSDMKAVAAASAALAAASGFGGDVSVESNESAEDLPTMDGVDHEKNWTKKLKTDDQTILRTAKEAQKMEKMAQRRIEEIANGDSECSSYEYVSIIDRIEKDEDSEQNKEPLKLIAMDGNGIRCINDETHECEWEIKFKNKAEYQKAAALMKWAGLHMNNYAAATDQNQWVDFLSGKVSESSFKNTLKETE